MNSTLDVLFLRRPKIDYISPPVCEVIFSSSSGPVIVLNPLTPLSAPTGLVLGGVGGFLLSWNTYPGALCYSVYKSVNPDDAFGAYVIVAECIPNPPIDLESFGAGFYRVSAITTDGETPLSLPIHFDGGGGGLTKCPEFTGPAPMNPIVVNEGDPITIGPIPIDPGFGFGPLIYEWSKDGLFFADTTATTQNSLVIDPSIVDDTGVYNLVVSNDNPDCTIVSEFVDVTVNTPGFEWDLVWSSLFESLGNAPGTINKEFAVDGFQFDLTQTNFINSGVTGVYQGAKPELYTGPAVNCRLHLVVTDPNPVNLQTATLQVSVDGTPVLDLMKPDIENTGTYDFDFTIPISVAAQITVDVFLSIGNILMTNTPYSVTGTLTVI